MQKAKAKKKEERRREEKKENGMVAWFVDEGLGQIRGRQDSSRDRSAKDAKQGARARASY